MSIAAWSRFHTGHFVVKLRSLLSMVSSSELLRYYRGIVMLLDFMLVDLGILVHDKRQKHSALIGLLDNTLVVTFSLRLKNTRIVTTEPRVICILQGYVQKLRSLKTKQLLQDKGSRGISTGYRIFLEDC